MRMMLEELAGRGGWELAKGAEEVNALVSLVLVESWRMVLRLMLARTGNTGDTLLMVTADPGRSLLPLLRLVGWLASPPGTLGSDDWAKFWKFVVGRIGDEIHGSFVWEKKCLHCFIPVFKRGKKCFGFM